MTTLSNITGSQIDEVIILVQSQFELLTSNVEGTAQVAKMIQIFLGNTFEQAVEILGAVIAIL